MLSPFAFLDYGRAFAQTVPLAVNFYPHHTRELSTVKGCAFMKTARASASKRSVQSFF